MALGALFSILLTYPQLPTNLVSRLGGQPICAIEPGEYQRNHDILRDHSLFPRLFSLDPLPLLIRRSTLHYPFHDFAGVDMLEIMLLDLLIDAELFGRGVGVVCKRHERRRPVVDRGGQAEGESA